MPISYPEPALTLIFFSDKSVTVSQHLQNYRYTLFSLSSRNVCVLEIFMSPYNYINIYNCICQYFCDSELVKDIINELALCIYSITEKERIEGSIYELCCSYFS